MLTVALLGSSLTTRVKRQAIQSAQKAYRTEILLETSQKLQKAEGSREILAVTATQLKKLLERDVLIYSADEDGLEQEAMLFPVSKGGDMSAYLTSSERAVAEWVWNNNKHAGATTHTLPSSKCLYIAVRGSDKVLAVVGIAIPNAQKVDSFEKNLTVAILDEWRTGAGKGADGARQAADRGAGPSGDPARQSAAGHLPRPAHPTDQYIWERRHPDGERGRAG